MYFYVGLRLVQKAFARSSELNFLRHFGAWAEFRRGGATFRVPGEGYLHSLWYWLKYAAYV